MHKSVLSNREEDKKLLKDEIDYTLKEIFSSYDDESAFSGIDPNVLRERIQKIDILPTEGLGFEGAMETMKKEVLPHLLRTWSPDYMPHLHSPALLESIPAELIISLYNNSMDSWDQSPAATEVEVAVIKLLTKLYGYDEKADGTFTSGGSQSNLSAITAARDEWCRKQKNWDVKKKGNIPDFGKLRLYTSELSHFSMEKSCHMLGLGYDAVVKLPTNEACCIDIKKAEEIIERDYNNGLYPFCIVATIGTTDFGSVDDVAALRAIADKYAMHLHADAAYGSGLIMSEKYKERIGNLGLCDSITVDFHKMFLLPISCSALLVKEASLLECFELHADYLNREEDEEDGYINLVGKSIQTTRRADAIKVMLSFLTRGKKGYGEIMDHDVENADFFFSLIKDDPAFIAPVRPTLSSVVFALNLGDEINKRVRRNLLNQGIVIGQTVMNGRVMLKFTLLNPALEKSHIEALVCRIRAEGDKEMKLCYT